jgi:aspartate/methionine/tyrosine aminotransferase
MKFSERTSWNLDENELTAAVRERRAAGLELIDLTVSNPTSCGFAYDEAALLQPLSEAAAMRYVPDPLGMRAARDAVAQYYVDAGAVVPVERICLTTSTSEAYSFLFRLLCNPGDEVLIARPSYPLFEYIAQLDDVTLREYPLFYDPNADATRGWAIDLHALKGMISARTKAVVVVHPNNPTGNFASEAERHELERVCAERGLALIVDEVFLDYAIGEGTRSFVDGMPQCLTLVLSGISKVCALPQMKASWMLVRGPEALVGKAMQRIEVIADTFLSMNAPIQRALPVWLAGRRGIQAQIRHRMKANLEMLDEFLKGTFIGRLEMQGGWTVVLRVPRTLGREAFERVALENGVLVQPGVFYGLPEGRAVLSLLTPTVVWERGVKRLVEIVS